MEQRYKTTLEIIVGLLKQNPFTSADTIINICSTALKSEVYNVVDDCFLQAYKAQTVKAYMNASQVKKEEEEE